MSTLARKIRRVIGRRYPKALPARAPAVPQEKNGKRWNIWDCEKCGEPTLCIELDVGVTPFMLRCRAMPGCRGMAQSRFYPKVPMPDLTVRGEWYAPDAAETAKLDPEMRHHVEQGGLLLRELPF